VPSEFLFDISKIDLHQVAIPAERIGQINPQSGHMRQLDYLIWADPKFSTGLGVKDVRDDEFWVPGHIPGRPLYPGVLMIEAAAQLSSILFRHRGVEGFIGFARCDEVAFRGQVVPGDRLYLLAKETEFKRRRFISANQGIVNGKLVFEATITGMVI
jgi:3-hydroxyacyl-[acyl-carrier-protein] dehydratase